MMPSAIAILVAITLTLLIAWAFVLHEEINQIEAAEELALLDLEASDLDDVTTATVHWHNRDHSSSVFTVAIERTAELGVICEALKAVPLGSSHEAAEMAVLAALTDYRKDGGRD